MLKQLTKQSLKCILAFFLLSHIPTAFALSSDVEKPVNIEADSAEFNKLAGTAIYSGAVSIKQGTLEIIASRVEIRAPNNEIQTITASGGPVKIKQQMDDGKMANGQAQQMIYQVNRKLLVLNGNAKLSQDQDLFTSNRIEYSTSTSQLRAGAATFGNSQPTPEQRKQGRVRAVFHPTNKRQ